MTNHGQNVAEQVMFQRRPIRGMLHDVIILVQLFNLVFHKKHKKVTKHFCSIFCSPGSELRLTPGMGMGGGGHKIATNHK